MASGSETDECLSMSSVVEQYQDGVRAAWAVALEVVAIPKQCPHVLQALLAALVVRRVAPTASAAAFEVALEAAGGAFVVAQEVVSAIVVALAVIEAASEAIEEVLVAVEEGLGTEVGMAVVAVELAIKRTASVALQRVHHLVPGALEAADLALVGMAVVVLVVVHKIQVVMVDDLTTQAVAVTLSQFDHETLTTGAVTMIETVTNNAIGNATAAMAVAAMITPGASSGSTVTMVATTTQENNEGIERSELSFLRRFPSATCCILQHLVVLRPQQALCKDKFSVRHVYLCARQRQLVSRRNRLQKYLERTTLLRFDLVGA